MASWWKKVFGSSEPTQSDASSPVESAPPAEASSDESSSPVAVAEPEPNDMNPESQPWWEQIDQLVAIGDRMVPVAGEKEAGIVQRVEQRLQSGNFPLPVLPFTLLKAIELSNAAEPDLAALAHCVRGDAVIAGEVMSLVNSAAYMPSQPIKDLHRAVVHVGARRARALMIGVAARLTVFRNVDTRRAQMLWAHALACGVLSRAIARASASDPEEAFLGGLLHDIGKTVILGLVAEEERANAGVAVPDSLVEKLCDEAHAGVGAKIAEQWRLHPELAEAIEHHHGLHPKSGSLVAIVSLANDVCGSLGIGVERRKVSLGNHRAFPILGLEAAKGHKLLQLLPAVLEEAPEFKGVAKKALG